MTPPEDKPYDPLVGKDFEAFINKTLEDTQTPGIAVAVVKGDDVWSGGWGLADLATKEPVTPHTLFLTCSTTKSFTAALTSKLVYPNDKSTYGDIKWSTRLADLIKDDFVLQDDYAAGHTTLEDALSHRTGMPRHDLSWINGDLSLKDMVRSMRHLPLRNEIRATYEYCNLMYHTVAYALERVTGRTMKDLLHSWLWEPLGMSETVWTLVDAKALVGQSDGRINLARGYVYDDDTKSLRETSWQSLPPANGAGGIISNVLDYTKWMRLFLRPDDTILPPAAVKDMTSGHIPIGNVKPYIGTVWYGLGLNSGVYRSHVIAGHSGALAGYMSEMLWIPGLEWGCVVMHNSYRLTHRTVIWRLIDDFLGTPDEERFDAAGSVGEFLDNAAEKKAKARERLYPSAPERGQPTVPPALPLESYEGSYHHPAYNTFTLSIPKQYKDDSSIKTEPEQSRHSQPEPIILQGSPAANSYLDLALKLEHINAEYWLARLQNGASCDFDVSMKARFEIGADGKVEGMRLQAEPEIEGLALFERTR